MKNFIGIFLACIVVTYIFSFFFLGLIVENVWALVIFAAFLLAVFITVFISQESRIEELEKKVEELSSNKQD
ncbi:hypothetical protein [Alkalibacillus salilacus]|uniref:Tellurium resistance membrane protein TerC n=1 Tax=Alkalibacillus salilacus TaxID=284582 RepID=A0ABT9VBH6_9BACI|nr:hypothetical protein [Alkalibacillus salilacus]MDQ0158303.1 putative tellurium resistance membrane protein TerC [Alkalibacillus salilacus]